MEATRVGRAMRLARKLLPSRKEAPQATVADVTLPALSLPLERIALVVCVLARERAAELLGGLVDAEAGRALRYLERFAAMPSAQRHAKVAAEFGERADAANRLALFLEAAPEALRQEALRGLPPYHRSRFPQWEDAGPPGDAAPVLTALAERRIREALR
ncbi:hypothetical protein D7W79_00310 [Corallococcus exercitus]|uniref:Uncharacterized protein n=1 Tax=Corallococcus exercitus TaxID=2316736 RepID=A0A3A8ILQ7_9BACT|nr:hypothetical protein [Corallococcus exercitus]NOK31811.1 hypothetical protein [Corallococcus exercitus]RKG83396.1 hypothetical protein D7W79_00310 [Corallococcus exercitus]